MIESIITGGIRNGNAFGEKESLILNGFIILDFQEGILRMIQVEIFPSQKLSLAFQRCCNLGNVHLLSIYSGLLKAEMSLLFPMIIGPPDEASLRIINQVIISILPMTIMV